MLEDHIQMWRQDIISCVECKKVIYSKPLGIEIVSESRSFIEELTYYCRCDQDWLWNERRIT